MTPGTSTALFCLFFCLGPLALGFAAFIISRALARRVPRITMTKANKEDRHIVTFDVEILDRKTERARVEDNDE
jgi:hypothetical protein